MEEPESVKSDTKRIYQKLEQIESVLRNLNENLKNFNGGQAVTVIEDPKKKELEKKLLEETHRAKELEQEKYILGDMNVELGQQTEELTKHKQSLESKLKDVFHRANEAEQAQMFTAETLEMERAKHERNKKIYIIIALVGIVVVSSTSVYLSYAKTWELEKLLAEGQFPGKYVVQNLKGDTVNTWISWRLASGDKLHVNVINTANAPKEKVDAVLDTIFSTKTRKIDDALFKEGQVGQGLYFDGWASAMQAAADIGPTKYYIPAKLDVTDPEKVVGAISIELVKEKSPDGYAGFTRSITDQNQILKSTIVIYNIDNLSIEQIKVVTRHEVGHALGLAHSTAPEDLMAPVVKTKYPYIGECDLAAINGLYDGNKKSEVVCER